MSEMSFPTIFHTMIPRYSEYDLTQFLEGHVKKGQLPTAKKAHLSTPRVFLMESVSSSALRTPQKQQRMQCATWHSHELAFMAQPDTGIES